MLDHYNNKTDFSHLESLFTMGYLERLGTQMGLGGFRYVLNTPIKSKSANIPKYRMIFATNHVDGALVMADNMNRRWQEFLERDRSGQMLLFDPLKTTEGRQFGHGDIDGEILALLRVRNEVDYKQVLMTILQKFGIAISEKEIANRVKELQACGQLTLERVPNKTP